MKAFLITLLFAASCQAAEVSVRFSPKGGCTEAIVEQIDKANDTILMSAYNFTSDRIGNALVDALERGVNVFVVQDNSAAYQKNFQGKKIKAAHGFVRLDKKHRITHNKVLIVDGKTIVTGSFNFSENAERYNAENLVIITRDRKLVNEYSVNWSNHWVHSKPFTIERQKSPKATKK